MLPGILTVMPTIGSPNPPYCCVDAPWLQVQTEAQGIELSTFTPGNPKTCLFLQPPRELFIGQILVCCFLPATPNARGYLLRMLRLERPDSVGTLQERVAASSRLKLRGFAHTRGIGSYGRWSCGCLRRCVGAVYGRTHGMEV